MSDRFSVDLDDLDVVVAELEATEAALTSLADDVERRVGVLQDEWDGLAADAQARAHREWARGLATMHAALADLRRAARTAHGAYADAVSANLALWRQVAP